jgi:chromosome segregation ATPase
MNALTGMEKFSHLEDKIYLTIEYAKKMRDEKERLEREADGLKRDASNAIAEKAAMEEKLAVLLSERDSIQLKVEAMLDAITMIDTDVAEAVGR